MRLALVRREFNSSGGAELYAQRLLTALAQAGHAPCLFAQRWESVPSGVELRLVTVEGTRAQGPRRFAEAMERALARERFDCVFSLERGIAADVYRAGDGVDVSADATVTLTVSSTAQPPLAVADSYRTDPATPLVVGAAEGVLANDSDSNGDALLAELISGAGQGTLALNPDGAFSYSPNTGFIGQDSFTYRAGDGALLSDPATVTLSLIHI